MIPPSEMSPFETALLYIGAVVSGYLVGSLIERPDNAFLALLIMIVGGLGVGAAWTFFYSAVLLPLIRGWNGQ